jgi:transcriptional regulator with XRE-family HTH domain
LNVAHHIPTVRQRRLAQALRELRHEAGLTQDAVAARMEWHSSKLFRLENARSPRVDWLDVRELMDLYGVPSPHREALIQLARDARMMGWWTPYRDVFTGSYVALEDEASAMRLYCPELVPGLLQTEHYARTVIRAVRPGYDDESVERRVTARLVRQKALLDRENSPELLCVLNEAVLRRQVGEGHVMAAQLRALADAAARPHLTLQVLPFSAGAHAALEGGFVLIAFPDAQDPDVGYVEGIMGDLYLESVEEIKRYQLAFERIQAIALSPPETLTLISALEREQG